MRPLRPAIKRLNSMERMPGALITRLAVAMLDMNSRASLRPPRSPSPPLVGASAASHWSNRMKKKFQLDKEAYEAGRRAGDKIMDEIFGTMERRWPNLTLKERLRKEISENQDAKDKPKH
jgi:hypothetical protein